MTFSLKKKKGKKQGYLGVSTKRSKKGKRGLEERAGFFFKVTVRRVKRTRGGFF